MLGVFIAVEAGLTAWARTSATPTLLARASAEERGDVYSSLASTAGALLGFTIAAVAVLVSFKKAGRGARDANLGTARRRLVVVLLVTAAFLGLTLVLATVGLGVDRGASGHEWLEHLALSAAVASIIGLAIGGVAFLLAILEQGK